ncbi:glycosyltransferase family 4 protein [Angustibacter peucedani]
MTALHVVLPEGVDDPARRSGGNVYDRRLCDGLRADGWDVVEHAVPGTWPVVGAAAWGPLGRLLAALDGSLVLLDGLVACAVPELLRPNGHRLRLVVLVHLPLALGADAGPDTAERESEVLHAAAGVVTTSRWCQRWLVTRYDLDELDVHVAEPGVDRAAPAPGTPAGDRLLCVGSVAPHKGQDVLLAALAQVDAPWTCTCVGSLTTAPAFVDELARQAERHRLTGRFLLTGPLVGADLAEAMDTADVLLLPSRTETYGMVVTEALARAVPVVATEVGGVPEALGHDGEGHRPGLLVPPDDPRALADAVRWWLGDPGLRLRLRASARRRRDGLTAWTTTAARVHDVLRSVAASPAAAR